MQLPTNNIMEDQPKSEGLFSVFRAPITNKKPCAEISLRQAWIAIRGNRYLAITQKLRILKNTDEGEYKRLKASQLDYVSFAGIFTHHSDSSITRASGLMCLDFDHIENVPAKRRKLITDPIYPPLLLFTSPGGDGLKMVIRNPLASDTYQGAYKKAMDHFFRRYGLAADVVCINISRACFLCYDPNAYLFDDTNIKTALEGWDLIQNITIDGEVDK